MTGWLLRNAVLTGWLLLPAAVVPLSVDWSVPRNTTSSAHQTRIQTVEGQREIIQAWARQPGPGYLEAIDASLSDWLPGWYERNKSSVEVGRLWPIGLGALAIALVLAIRWGRWRFCEAALPVIALLQLLFWFLKAPDIRFGSGLFGICFAAAFAWLLSIMHERIRPAIVWGVALLVVAIFTIPEISKVPSTWQQADWRWGKAHSAPVRLIAVNDQSPPLEVCVPLSGDQLGDAPLPAAPYPSRDLEARIPGRWWEGFRRTRERAGNDVGLE